MKILWNYILLIFDIFLYVFWLGVYIYVLSIRDTDYTGPLIYLLAHSRSTVRLIDLTEKQFNWYKNFPTDFVVDRYWWNVSVFLFGIFFDIIYFVYTLVLVSRDNYLAFSLQVALCVFFLIFGLLMVVWILLKYKKKKNGIYY